MSDWQTQVDKLLEEYEGITGERYAAGLAAFRTWHLQSFRDEPDAALLTDNEVRNYRVYLTGVKGYKAGDYPHLDQHPRCSGSQISFAAKCSGQTDLWIITSQGSFKLHSAM